MKSDIAKLNDRVTAYEQGISGDSCRKYTVNEFKEYVNSNNGKKYSILTLGDELFETVLTGALEYDECLDEFRVIFGDGCFNFDHRIINNVNIYNNGKIDLVSATDAGGLAEAMSRTATTADMAGVSMDKLLGYLAVTGEVTQKSMSSIGESYKTIFTRMSDIKSNKLELVDEDGTTETLSDVELTLKNVGIDLRKTVTEYNSYEEVLDSLAAKWDTLNQVQQNALTKAFAGTRQGENFRVLMENYDKAVEYSNVAADSLGTAEEKFDAYLDSIEAKTKSLQANFESLANNTVSTEMIGGIIDTTSAIINLIDKSQILKGTLTGLAVAGTIKTFSKLFLRLLAILFQTKWKPYGHLL
ncbi:MAG: phage tail tape measure protein [Eubacterium sp.]|nr:phage tail tape measure protein [Eubacterium sp.]